MAHHWQGWGGGGPARCRQENGADAGNRTPDPIITSDVLYQLSYVGGRA